MTSHMTATMPRSRINDISPDNDLRWADVVARNATADGTFVYAVKTTGVYCRPSCKSRTALRKNVAFFASPAEAEDAGFRACLRCRPTEQPTDDIISRACRFLTEAEMVPSLADLGHHVGLSSHHIHRLFKQATGITPKAYFNAERAKRLRNEIAAGESVTSAIYGAGYGSSSRFYETSTQRLGMPASVYQRGGKGTTIRFAIGDCSLGNILIAATDKGVAAVEFADAPEPLLDRLAIRFPGAELVAGDADFERMAASVIALVEEPAKAVDLPIDVRGTAFQERVWQALRRIPAGATATYAEIAAMIGEPKSTRAVANACGANRVAVVIPCHRVVRTDGGSGGYRWGIARKEALLAREAKG